jgi:hypothetical protein
MDLLEAARVVRKRWYVMLPLLLLTIIAIFGIDRVVPTKYQATSTISLLASSQTVQGTAAAPGTKNAFLSFDASLNDMADFLVRRLDAADSALQLQGLGVTEAYAAALAANAQGPFITLTVTGTNAEHVTASINTLLSYTKQELAGIQTQASVEPSAMIGSVVIVAPAPPTAQLKGKVQGVIGVGVSGLVFAFLATFVTENIAASRRRRRGYPRPRSGQPRSELVLPAAVSQIDGPAEGHGPGRIEVLSGLPESRD